jgi:hypothetical protein
MKKKVKLLFVCGIVTLFYTGFIYNANAQGIITNGGGDTNTRVENTARSFKRLPQTGGIIEIGTPAQTGGIIETGTPAQTGGIIEIGTPAQTGGRIEIGTPAQTGGRIEIGMMAPGGTAVTGTQGDQITLGGANQGTQMTLTAGSAAQPAVTLTNALTQTGTVPTGRETATTQTAGTTISFDALINDYTTKGIAASTKFMGLYNNAINQMKTDMQNANGTEEMLAIYNTLQDTISQARDNFSAELTQIQNEFTQRMNTQRDEIIKNSNAISAVQ